LRPAMLLEWLGERHAQPALGEASRALSAAIDAALADPQVRTGDLGGKGSTTGFGEAVARSL
jgi:3-isopropylmalate dehydrogenase